MSTYNRLRPLAVFGGCVRAFVAEARLSPHSASFAAMCVSSAATHRCTGWGLPHLSTASASRSGCLTRLNTRHVRSPRLRRPPRVTPHDSGPMWAASSHSCDFFVHTPRRCKRRRWRKAMTSLSNLSRRRLFKWGSVSAGLPTVSSVQFGRSRPGTWLGGRKDRISWRTTARRTLSRQGTSRRRAVLTPQLPVGVCSHPNRLAVIAIEYEFSPGCSMVRTQESSAR